MPKLLNGTIGDIDKERTFVSARVIHNITLSTEMDLI